MSLVEKINFCRSLFSFLFRSLHQGKTKFTLKFSLFPFSHSTTTQWRWSDQRDWVNFSTLFFVVFYFYIFVHHLAFVGTEKKVFHHDTFRFSDWFQIVEFFDGTFHSSLRYPAHNRWLSSDTISRLARWKIICHVDNLFHFSLNHSSSESVFSLPRQSLLQRSKVGNNNLNRKVAIPRDTRERGQLKIEFSSCWTWKECKVTLR